MGLVDQLKGALKRRGSFAGSRDVRLLRNRSAHPSPTVTDPDHLAYAIGRQRTHHNCSFAMWKGLDNLRRNGFSPGGILDIGAYDGQWTRLARAVFPESPVFMIEANPDKEPVLLAVTAEFQGFVEYAIQLLGPRRAESVEFFLMDSGGSSVLPENTTFPRSLISLPMATLDDVVGRALSTPLLLKVDVQGYEIAVLQGGSQTLEGAEVLVLEVSLLEYNVGSPLFADVVDWMRNAGFFVYDICGYARRESDDALFQVDLMFVRENSVLRRRRPFWTQEHDPSLGTSSSRRARGGKASFDTSGLKRREN